MRRPTQLFSAIAMGAAVAVALPAAGQQDSPADRAEQQQEGQSQQQPAEQQPRERDDQPSSPQEAQSQQRETDQNQPNQERTQQPPADPQRDRDDDQQQRQQGDQQQQQSDRQQRRAMLGVAFAEQGDRRQGQEAAPERGEDARQDQEGDRQGLEIAAIMPGSAAEQANLQQGDVIVSADGQEVRSAEELDRIIQQRSVGDTLDLVILRNNQQQQMQVTLQAAPEMDSRLGSRRPDFDRSARTSSRGWLGVTLDTQEQQGQGVTINRVYPAGPAARAGLREGDKIVQVTGQQVSSYEDVLEVLEQTRPGDSVDLTVASNGQQQQVSVRLDDAGVFSDAEDEFDSSFMWRDPSGRTAEIPEHDMMLEQHRRFAEQHQRIEELLLEVKRDLEEIKQQMNGQQAQPREGQ